MKRVLLIDDEPLARMVVLEYLQQFTDQIEVLQECNDGFEGLKAIQQHQPDLIFLDVQMPKINGFEMLELVEQPPSVIFTTAFDEYAIKFGLYDTTEKVTVSIRGEIEGNNLVVMVQNPYDPQTSRPKGTGFGLRGVQRRLYLLFERNYLMETHQNDNIFTTIIKIPQVI